MIFVDTNVFMYAVGRAHPLRDAAREFLTEASRAATPLCTSAEVVQELAHAYLRASRPGAFDEALTAIAGFGVEVWPLEFEDVTLARELRDQYPHLQVRDLCHLASCRRRGVTTIKTFDRAFSTAVGPTVPEDA